MWDIVRVRALVKCVRKFIQILNEDSTRGGLQRAEYLLRAEGEHLLHVP